MLLLGKFLSFLSKTIFCDIKLELPDVNYSVKAVQIRKKKKWVGRWRCGVYNIGFKLI